MRPLYVVGNFKMNLLSRAECDKYLTLLRRELGGLSLSRTRLVLCPPVIHLPRFTHLPEGVALGAQNVSSERSGAFTGEISPLMLKDAGAEFVLVGHSERRAQFAETDDMVRAKVATLLKHLLVPIVCVGETEEERREETTTDVLERQIRVVFEFLSPMQAEKVIIAYEPRWAIGTDRVPTTEDILQVKVFLRKLFTEIYDPKIAERMVVIYGGSVKTSFLPAVSWEADLDGVLVGRESLFAHELVKMAKLLEEHEPLTSSSL